MGLRFDHPERLLWLWGLLPIALLLLHRILADRRAARRYAGASVRPTVMPGRSTTRSVLRAALTLAGLALLVVALLDPRWGEETTVVRRRGADVMIVLDVSKSMLAEDARPNRLERAKQFARDLLDAMGGDRAGLVVFAGVPTLRSPLTVDRGATRLALDLAEPESAPRGGSLLGDAIRLAARSFTDETPDHKAIVLLTDGEDHGSYAIDAAARVRSEQGIPTIAIGFGDATNGARIPVRRGGSFTWLRHEGEEVVTRLDADLLRRVAEAGEGAYVPLGTGDADVAALYDRLIAPLATRDLGATERRRGIPRYQWFAGAALALLLLESLVAPGRRSAA